MTAPIEMQVAVYESHKNGAGVEPSPEDTTSASLGNLLSGSVGRIPVTITSTMYW